MKRPNISEPRNALAMAAAILELVLAAGALGGGLALMLGPHGEIIPLPVALLQGSPFSDYFMPGLILFVVLGIGSAVVAVLAWRQQSWAPVLTVAVGAALLIWLVVQIAIIGYSNDPPLQLIYLVLGVATGMVGVAWMARTNPPRRALKGR
jgi:hypothetical protein